MSSVPETTDRGLLRLYAHCLLLGRLMSVDRPDPRERLESKLGPELTGRLVAALTVPRG